MTRDDLWTCRTVILLLALMLSLPSYALTVVPYPAGYAYDNVSPFGIGDGGVQGNPRVSPNERGILLFDISSLSGPVASAQLWLSVYDRSWSSSTSRTLGVYGRGGDGSIESTDYTLGSAAGSFVYSGSLLPASVDVTNFLNNYLATPDFVNCAGVPSGATCYLMLQVAWPASGGQSSSDYVRFAASLSYLDIAPVPLPAAAWLLLWGLVGLAALGRRRVSDSNA